jgi:hypothetical protein
MIKAVEQVEEAIEDQILTAAATEIERYFIA